MPVFSMSLVFSKEFTHQSVFFISVIKVLLKACIFQQILQNVRLCNREIVLKSLDYKCHFALRVQEGRHKLPVCPHMSRFLNSPDFVLLLPRVAQSIGLAMESQWLSKEGLLYPVLEKRVTCFT